MNDERVGRSYRRLGLAAGGIAVLVAGVYGASVIIGRRSDRETDRARLAQARTELTVFETCVAGGTAAADLFTAAALTGPTTCEAPWYLGLDATLKARGLPAIERPDLRLGTRMETLTAVCAFDIHAHAVFDRLATALEVAPAAGPACDPKAHGLDWVDAPGAGPRYVRVRGDVAVVESADERDAWLATSSDGATWTRVELPQPPLSQSIRDQTLAILVDGGAAQQLYVGSGVLEAKPKRAQPSSDVLVGATSIVLLGGNDVWLTAAWSTDGGLTFGPAVKVVQPEFVIARRSVLADGDALVTVTAEPTIPVLSVHRAEPGTATRVTKLAFEHADWKPAVALCQSGSVIWTLAGTRQVALSRDGGRSWTALPPLANTDSKVELVCTPTQLGLVVHAYGKPPTVLLCSDTACSEPLAAPEAKATHLRLTPQPELWTVREPDRKAQRIVTVYRVGTTLVADRAYVAEPTEVALAYDRGWIALTDD